MPALLALTFLALFIWTSVLLLATLLQISGFRDMVIMSSSILTALLAGLLYITTGKHPSDIIQLVAQETGTSAWDLVTQLEREFAK
jgi:hypothetical protein